MAIEQYEFIATEGEIPESESQPREECGACIRFEGIVRGLEEGRRIRGIDYTTYPTMLDSKAEALIEAGREKFGAHHVSIIHRLGFVPEAEAAVRIEVAHRNSEECFEICRWYLRAVKKELPIWKNPVFKKGQE